MDLKLSHNRMPKYKLISSKSINKEISTYELNSSSFAQCEDGYLDTGLTSHDVSAFLREVMQNENEALEKAGFHSFVKGSYSRDRKCKKPFHFRHWH
jgi:hypothetical protein